MTSELQIFSLSLEKYCKTYRPYYAENQKWQGICVFVIFAWIFREFVGLWNFIKLNAATFFDEISNNRDLDEDLHNKQARTKKHDFFNVNGCLENRKFWILRLAKFRTFNQSQLSKEKSSTNVTHRQNYKFFHLSGEKKSFGIGAVSREIEPFISSMCCTGPPVYRGRSS